MLKAHKARLAVFLSTLFLGLFLYSSTALFARAELASHGPRLAIDSLFAAWDRPDVPGYAVGVIQDGRLIYQRGYGMANVEESVPIASETLFCIGSMSKQFTAACIALLVISGKISLDDDIHTYVPELPDYMSIGSNTVTIRHLVHMMSGIQAFLGKASWQWDNGERFGGFFDNQDALDIILQENILDFEPGYHYDYSNSNYIILAEIIERVSGQTLREFADENIFRPLGMSHTFFKDDTTHVINYAAEYHESYAEPVFTYIPFEEEEFYYRYNHVVCGPSGLLTTIEDLYLWDQNFYDNKLEGGSEFIDLMLSTGEFNYGFGLRHTEYKGFKVIWHSGWIGGFVSIMMRFPEEELTIILLRNYEPDPATENPESVTVTEVADVYLSGQGEEYSQGCDFNGNGKLGIADVVKLLLLARDNPSDPLVDWNSDGAYSWADVILLVQDIWNGHCPPAVSALLASAGNLEQVSGPESLSAEDIAYIEQMMARMNLTPEQEAAFRLVLYGEAGAASLPKVFSLARNSPNPFNPSTTISYSVPEGASERIALKVYDLRGRLVRTLVKGIRGAGTYSVYWDGTDESGRQVSSGVYLYRMQAGEFMQTRKMVILK